MTTRDWRPRYLQVAEEIRAQILDGELQPGDPMPSEAALSKTYDLSRTSVRGAIRQLREWGLVKAEQGRGTYVRAQRQRVTRTPERYQWEKARAQLSEAERRKEGATEYDTGRTMPELAFSRISSSGNAHRPTPTHGVLLLHHGKLLWQEGPWRLWLVHGKVRGADRPSERNHAQGLGRRNARSAA